MNYIPEKDSDFKDWLETYDNYVNSHAEDLGLSDGQKIELHSATGTWNTNYSNLMAAQAGLRAATQAKDASRAAVEELVRKFTAIIQINPDVTNEVKATLGITIRKETRTATPVPTTRPMAKVDNVKRLEHIIDFFDETGEKSKAKPAGVRGCEIWCKIGNPEPVDESTLTYVATDTKTPYIAHFNGADAGKTVHYWLRWVNTRNEPGPWSETISVTISA
jgi:hypothetical protein